MLSNTSRARMKLENTFPNSHEWNDKMCLFFLFILNVARSRKLFPPSFFNSNMADFFADASLQFRTQSKECLIKY